jgi:hypothetical protein
MKGKLIKKSSHNREHLEYWLYCEELKYNLSPMAKTGAGHGLQKLSLKNCQAIERGYDVYELAKENYYKFWSIIDESGLINHTFGYVEGFQKALELMGDKKFSEEDIDGAFDAGYEMLDSQKNYNDSLKEFKKSLQQTEWDVEIDMTPYHDNNFINDGKTHIIKPIFKPTLDNEGCLILKRV